MIYPVAKQKKLERFFSNLFLPAPRRGDFRFKGDEMLTVGRLRELLAKYDDDALISVEIYVPETEYISLDDRIKVDSEGDVTLFSADLLG